MGFEPIFFFNKPSFIDFQKRANKFKINKLQIKLQDYKILITNYKLQITNYNIQITKYKTQNTKLQVTDHKLQNTFATTLRTNSNKLLHVPHE